MFETETCSGSPYKFGDGICLDMFFRPFIEKKNPSLE